MKRHIEPFEVEGFFYLFLLHVGLVKNEIQGGAEVT